MFYEWGVFSAERLTASVKHIRPVICYSVQKATRLRPLVLIVFVSNALSGGSSAIGM